MEITKNEVQEALEQVRAGFTISRMALGAITLLHPLKKKDEKWAKKFSKIQHEYHTFLLASYKELEAEFDRLSKEEAESKKEDALS